MKALRHCKASPLSEFVQLYIKQMGLERKMKEMHLINSWPEIAGKTIASRTKSIYFKNSVLFVELNSSVVRNELNMIRHGLVDALNRNAGEEIVTDIVFR